jgi:hypothetical protein
LANNVAIGARQLQDMTGRCFRRVLNFLIIKKFCVSTVLKPCANSAEEQLRAELDYHPD